MSTAVKKRGTGDARQVTLEEFTSSNAEERPKAKFALIESKGQRRVVVYIPGEMLGGNLPIDIALNVPFEELQKAVEKLSKYFGHEYVEKPTVATPSRIAIYDKRMLYDVLAFAVAVHGGARPVDALDFASNTRRTARYVARHYAEAVYNCKHFGSACDVAKAFPKVVAYMAEHDYKVSDLTPEFRTLII